MTSPKLLTPAQAAEFLGVSAGYLAQQRLRGNGCRYVKLGAKVMYDQADLLAFVEANKRTTTSGTGEAVDK